MAKCAFCGNEVNFGDKPVSYCKGGCYRTLFLCKCGTANRPLAVWCRYCGKEVSYPDTENRISRHLRITASSLNQPFLELPLSQFGIAHADELFQLYFSYGYMFLLLKTGKILILNCCGGDIQASLDLSEGKLYSLPLEVSTKETQALKKLEQGGTRGFAPRKDLFIFTAREMHRLDLIRDFHSERVSLIGTDNMELDRQPIWLDGRFFLALRDERQSTTQLKLVSPEEKDREISLVKGRISQPVRTGNKVFFYTRGEIFIYDHAKQDISYKGDNRYGFNIDSVPKSEGLRAYVLGSESRIYRISLASEIPEVFGLPHPQIVQANFEVADERILISHSGGVLVTNVLGQTEWSSEQLLSIYPAYKFSPLSFGNYIAFVMTYPTTEVLHIVERPSYKQAVSCLGNFVFKPVFYAGQLYVIVDEDGNLKVRAYSL